MPLNLTAAQWKDWASGEDMPIDHGAKVKADTTYAAVLGDGLIESVKALTEGKVVGVREHYFNPPRKHRFDVAFVDQKIAVELNGWKSHHRRKRMEEDNVKLAAAVRLGWRVFYASADQFRRQAPLWIVDLIGQQTAKENQCEEAN